MALTCEYLMFQVIHVIGYVLADDVPEYTLPFVKEVGERPTLEAMRRIVVQNNKRPQIPEAWKKHEVIQNTVLVQF